MKRLSRRNFLNMAAVAAGSVLVARPDASALATAEPAWTPIGFSQAGSPLIVHHLGHLPRRVFLLGGQHGGPEANTIRLVQQLMAHLVANSGEIPERFGIDIMAIGNPDGAAAGSRQFLSGVDPNRNWGGPDWQPDAYDSNGQFREGLGGQTPFSEQETRALRDWLTAVRPELVINYHSAGGFMFGGRDGRSGEIAEAYSTGSGYARPTPGVGSSPLSYRATGSMNVWMREIGIAGLFIELTNPWDPEFGRNLAGLKAALGVLTREA